MAKPRIAITMGDPAGIGPEICLQFLRSHANDRGCLPVVFGDSSILNRVSNQLSGRNLDESDCQIVDWDQWPKACSNLDRPTLLDLKTVSASSIEPGTVNERTGQSSYRYIEASIEASLGGQVDAVTTGPIHKEAIRAAGVPYPGHTEIYAAKTNAQRACMMLTCNELTCSFVTTHVGYRDVPGLLSRQRIGDVIQLSHDAIQRLKGKTPKLVVCGLNPHAGEGGLFGGSEEEQFIIPAIQEAQDRGLDVVGPLPPDTAFLPGRRAETDCFVCMYHDQGHIPLKALAFDLAVNITLGLPIIRTSVDHGTALDIAWQGIADVTSLKEAVDLATRLATGEARV